MNLFLNKKENKMKYQYTVDDDDKCDIESRYDEEDVEYIAECAAEDYHSNHDGWESEWPIEFEIFLDDKSIGKFLVEREYSPSFSATEIKPEAIQAEQKGKQDERNGD